MGEERPQGSDGCGHARKGRPSPWVSRFLAPAAPGQVMLDVACGGGRHLRAARAAGYAVIGIDRDLSGVADLACAADVRLIAADLEAGAEFPVPPGSCDGVIVTNYLWRPLLPAIVAAVAENGVLIYETFASGNERYGRPSNPDFLLQPGELLEAVRPCLVAIAYEHGTLMEPHRVVQRIAAVGRLHTWVDAPPPLEEAVT